MWLSLGDLVPGSLLGHQILHSKPPVLRVHRSSFALTPAHRCQSTAGPVCVRALLSRCQSTQHLFQSLCGPLVSQQMRGPTHQVVGSPADGCTRASYPAYNMLHFPDSTNTNKANRMHTSCLCSEATALFRSSTRCQTCAILHGGPEETPLA